MKKILTLLLSATILTIFFSYKLTEIPNGINGDEASFGYNAVLLSRNLRDENDRKFPIFVLSMAGKDWRQPVLQYLLAGAVKMAGPSLYTIRMVSVLTATVSILMIYLLGRMLMGSKGGTVTALLLATTPIILIQSHLAFDNITPLPFVIGWLIFMLIYLTRKKIFLTFLAGVCLGVGLYTFKSMRIFVPPWILTSAALIIASNINRTTKSANGVFSIMNGKAVLFRILKPVGGFMAGIFPFFAIIPWLEFQYAGAVLNNADGQVGSLYNFLHNYLANFDPSFLFIRGDELLIHSTGVHGMVLVASLPLFILGIANLPKKDLYWKFLVVSLVLGPLLFGYIGQVHRANRLLPLLPLFCLLSANGFINILKQKSKIMAVLLSLILIANFVDFVRYYWYSYGDSTKHLYTCYRCLDEKYKYLKQKSEELSAEPYIDAVLVREGDYPQKFVSTIYFNKEPSLWNGEKNSLPKNSLLMTDNANIGYYKKIGSVDNYSYYVTY